MSNRTQHIVNHVDELLSGYLDGELTQQQRQRVELHCADCEKCATSLAEIRALSESLGKARLSNINQSEWRELMDDTAVKTSLGIGWILLAGGLIAAFGLGVYEFVLNSSLGLVGKLAISAIYVGLFALFVSVVRQRWIERKTDKYKDVEI